MVPPAEPRNPQLAPRNAVQINLSHSGVQCLIQTGVPLHKLPNRGCFGGGQCSIVPVGRTSVFRGIISVAIFISLVQTRIHQSHASLSSAHWERGAGDMNHVLGTP